jgi:sugar phosphate isomerase/epimerase
MANPLALHTWTLDTTPLDQALAAARRTGWDAVELRRVDFLRAREAGRRDEDVFAAVRATGLPVACVGVQFGWMWAQGAERAAVLEAFAEGCRRAVALGCPRVMSPVDFGEGDPGAAAASVREVGDLAAAAGVDVAIEFQSIAARWNTLGRVRELLARAGHPRCALLLDTYHLGRSGARPAELEDLRPEEIGYVQVSDVPRRGVEPGKVLDRLPPGRGGAPIREYFAAILARGYRGPISYEAPNPAAWARPPDEVAGEALAAVRAALP